MTRRLLLLRHAHAEPHPVAGAARNGDRGRPLALDGRGQLAGLAGALSAAGLVPDVVLCSSALRTQQTWQLLRAGLPGAQAAALVSSDALYDGGVETLVDLVRGAPADAGTVLVVGHNPTISQAASALAGGDGREDLLARVHAGLPTAGCVELEVEAAWSELAPGGARLVSLVTP